jgi:predicted Zn-ribbon and HTH transcriptional regulator
VATDNKRRGGMITEIWQCIDCGYEWERCQQPEGDIPECPQCGCEDTEMQFAIRHGRTAPETGG